MTFILRWPAILVLFALVALSAMGALGAASLLTGYAPPVEQAQQAQAAAAETGAASAGWLDVGLLAAAAIFFLIAAVRLIRRTQGFWMWLLGFACYAGRWAYAQGQGVIDQIRAIDFHIYLDPQGLVNNIGSTETQVAILALVLVVGLFIFIVDAADRAYWDRQGG
ncbi:MAG: hypothetical protein KF700_07755 [Hyphomonadaceae bacterium]|nr:hypothetical protein [Hyphomonadaceae bacterium]